MMASSLGDLQRQLRQKDEKIRELEAKLSERDVQIQDIRSQLDQYKSILPSSRLSIVDGGRRPRKPRQGIAGPRLSFKDMPTTFKKYSKTQR